MKAILFQAVAVSALAAIASAQVPAGGEFRVNSYTTSYQIYSSTAMESGGDFVVVWASRDQDGSLYGVLGRRFAASGAPQGGEFLVNQYTTGSQTIPHVAIEAKGDFTVVWGSAQDGSGSSIHGRRYDSAGAPIGGEFPINTYTTGGQIWPRVGRAADGRSVVVWSGPSDGTLSGIAARRFDASGNAVGGEFLVNTYTTGIQGSGDFAVSANGDFVVVWEDFAPRDGSSSAIFAQRFDGSGAPVGGEFQVNSYTTGAQRWPSVSASPGGGFAVVWSSQYADGSGYAAMARRFDAVGNPVGPDFVANTYTTGDQTGRFGQVAHDALGNFVVTWTSDDGGVSGTFGQRFSASGVRRGGEFRANTFTTGFQGKPSAASDSVGNFVMAWESLAQDGSGSGIFAQRFGGLVPAALGVDSLGNRVLEPGETVDVRPSWRNVNGAAQAFGGTLANVTGPAGATYAITDAAGDYGTVPDGATAPCTNCYAVSVSNPTARPTVHWDASAVESISPDTQGQQKQWLLHVGRSFTDVLPSSGFYRFVETLLHHGVTGGCSATQYCPSSATTRDQMAVFVLVAKEGAGYVPPACGTPVFNDVPASSPFCRWIEELARRAVVSGCGGGNYCPAAEVTREQMAVFVLRTLDPALAPPACTTPVYNDVPASNGFCRWIEELTRRNVVSGCGGGNYCPTASVTREQMGVFISVTFGLTLYGP